MKHNNFAITLEVYESPDNYKIKVHYSMIPVEKLKVGYKSLVSDEFVFETFVKTRKKVTLVKIYQSDEGFVLSEKKLIKKAAKYLAWRIPFRFKYKKALRKRVERILG